MKKINLVLHTHWDREWYFTTSDSLVLMDRTFKNIVTELEKNDKISFCLDGQSSILEEFLEINPDYKQRIERLVVDSKLFIGPWYTQTDAQLVSGESMLRNLFYGMKYILDNFSNPMMVGYLPDTFGFNHQMPEILNHANIDNIIFWRGADFEKQNLQPYFTWVGQGRSKITALNLIDGYGGHKWFDGNEEYYQRKVVPYLNKFNNYKIEDNILIPIGNDQFEIKKNFDSEIENLNLLQNDYEFKITNYQSAINDVINLNLEEYNGEFRKTAYTRIHKSIGSSRMDVKKSNYICEEMLVRRLEPLMLAASNYSINIGQGIVDKAWKKLLEGQAHDGICACISDSVRDDIINRNKSVEEICDSLENSLMKRMAKVLSIQEDEVLIFNSSFKRENRIYFVDIFSEYKDISMDEDYSLIETIKADGRTNALVEGKFDNSYVNVPDTYLHKVAISKSIEPGTFAKVKFYNNHSSTNKNINSISINGFMLDKNLTLNGLSDFIILEACANDGDTYDFSPLNDKIIISNPKFNRGTDNGLYQSLTFNGVINIPQTLNDWQEMTNKVEMEYALTISQTSDEYCKVNLEIDNKCDSYRLRVGIRNFENAHNSIASTQFGYIKREVLNGHLEDNWQERNVEMPIDIEIFDEFVTIESNQKNPVIYTTYAKEYQVVKDYTYITVFATTGELGKADLKYRPGRASGDVTKKGHVLIDTPKAQLHGAHSFDFYLTVASNEENYLFNLGERIKDQTIFYQNQEINKFYNRIDNKIMDYETYDLPSSINKTIFKTEDRIYSSYLLDGKQIFRLLKLSDNPLSVNCKFEYVDLYGNITLPPSNKFQVYSIRIL